MQHGSGPGVSRALTAEEEKSLVNHLLWWCVRYILIYQLLTVSILQHVCQILVILHNSFLNSGKSVGTSSMSDTVSSVVNTSNSNPNAVVNPLVVSGLISPDLADILVTPSGDATVTKNHTRRIVGARDLTAEDYVSMLHEDKRKKEEAEKRSK